MSKELVQRLRHVSNMINMGEKIRWGEDTALMDQAADLIERMNKTIDDMERALQPFSSAVFNDNGDVTINYSVFDDDDLFRAYSVLRKLRADPGLPQPPNKGE
ncbi:hypothetical protein [Pelagibacterium sediminicola]|uniref:hypothetical protein n=1 Tax=Pelagibacterium sediminicola TaxID=2248761 RepID=UPI0013005C0B|nr:hypothetical protein [Pelagibacterium sediminicola]